MKTVCIYNNSSIDGLMSAGVFKHWYLKLHKGNALEHGNVIVDPNEGLHSLTFIDYNHEQPIPDLSEYDEVIMLGVSFLKEEMSKLWHNLDLKLIWIDNRKSTINDNNDLVWKGLQDTKYGISELTWKYFFTNEEMPEIIRLIGLYASWRHIGTSEEKKVLEFQYAIRKYITNYKEAYDELLIAISEQSKTRDEVLTTYRYEDIHIEGICIYQYLCTEAKQVYKNGFEIWFPIQHIEVIGRKFICINKERFNPIDFGIDYCKDGYGGVASFYITKDGNYNFTLYSNTVDCNAIAKQYQGNGTKEQAEMILTNEQFIKLIN